MQHSDMNQLESSMEEFRIPNPRHQPQTDVAEEVQRRVGLLHDRTKKNILQSYLFWIKL